MTDGAPAIVVQVSPLLFAHPRIGDASVLELTKANSYSSLSRTATRLLMAALEPVNTDALAALGFDRATVMAALAEGLLVVCSDPVTVRAQAWETRGWSRAAYLWLSQLNIPYAEEAHQPTSLDETVSVRRQVLRDYLGVAAYPQRFLAPSDRMIPLPRPEGEASSDWKQLFARRSVRRFSPSPIPQEAFARTLWAATELVRVGEASKQTDDPFFLLNSFYTWLVILVAVQKAEGVPRGLYQYDPLRHELRDLGRTATDARIASAVQNQIWIGGGGFCVFVAAQWERYMWLYRHSRAYINLLIQTGEFGHELLREGAALGLGGWMTPAVNESLTQEMFGLPDSVEVLYFQKLGTPRPSPVPSDD